LGQAVFEESQQPLLMDANRIKQDYAAGKLHR
jgi:hypothetical protein